MVPPKEILTKIKKIDADELNQLKKRTDAVTLVIIFFIAIVITRLWFLQIHSGSDYREKADNNRVRMRGNDTAPMIPRLIVAILMFGNASAMLVAGITIGKGNRWCYYFATTWLVVNIILTFTDQFGISDLFTLIIDSILLGLILISSKVFLQPT